MPAKKNPPRLAGRTIHRDIAGMIDLTNKAYVWFEKSLAHRKAGKRALAEAAEKKGRDWLKKALALEVLALNGEPIGGRRLEE